MSRDNKGDGIWETRRWKAGHMKRGELGHHDEYGGVGH